MWVCRWVHLHAPTVFSFKNKSKRYIGVVHLNYNKWGFGFFGKLILKIVKEIKCTNLTTL